MTSKTSHSFPDNALILSEDASKNVIQALCLDYESVFKQCANQFIVECGIYPEIFEMVRRPSKLLSKKIIADIPANRIDVGEYISTVVNQHRTKNSNFNEFQVVFWETDGLYHFHHPKPTSVVKRNGRSMTERFINGGYVVPRNVTSIILCKIRIGLDAESPSLVTLAKYVVGENYDQ